MNERLKLRDPVNVPDAMERDRIVRRIRSLRAQIAADRATYQHWNRSNPDAPPLSTDFEDRMIAWLDGEGPCPREIPKEPTDGGQEP